MEEREEEEKDWIGGQGAESGCWGEGKRGVKEKAGMHESPKQCQEAEKGLLGDKEGVVVCVPETV